MSDPAIPKGVNNSWVAQLNTSALERASLEDQIGSGLSWWYNYFSSQRARFPPGTGPGAGFTTAMTNANLDGTWAPIVDAEYCPMIAAPAHNNPTEVGWLTTECPGAMHLLGPTEPDTPTNDGIYTGYPVPDVVTLWQTVYEPWRAAVPGRLLGAPAVSQIHPADVAGDWLDLFMQQVSALSLNVDFIPLHFFFGYTGSGLASGTTIGQGLPILRTYLRNVWNLYHRPLWPEIGILGALATAANMANANAQCVAMFKALDHEMGTRIVQRWNFWPLGPWGIPVVNKPGLYAADGTITLVGIGMKQLS